MFFQFKEGIKRQITPAEISAEYPTVGYVSPEELGALNDIFRFDESDLEDCRNANQYFRSGAELHSDYTFTELRIMNSHEEDDDYIALFLKKNLVLVVDIFDADGSTRQKYLSSLDRYPPERVSCEKILSAFLDSLLSGDNRVLESLENDLEEKEEGLMNGSADADFNMELLQMKKSLTKRHSYYRQLMEVADTVCENGNVIFEENGIAFVMHVSKRLSQLHEDTAALLSNIQHLQDAYSSYLDSNMNKTMKIFTVLTSIFFPLTIIVGWYGMNFQYMPEFGWKWGYVYVIALSVLTVLLFALIGKKKKWF